MHAEFLKIKNFLELEERMMQSKNYFKLQSDLAKEDFYSE